MLIDLIDKLISRVVDLLKEEQRIKKTMHDNFIVPLMSQFEEIHENYVQTFIKYGEIISGGDFPITKAHPVVKEIKKDSLTSNSMRVKLGALWRALEDSKDNSSELTALLEAIGRYLQFAVESPVPSNVARAELTADLIGAAKEDADHIIATKIEQVQAEFSGVQEVYQALKIKYVK